MPFKVTWEVEDGYVGRSRPQTSFVYEEDVKDLSREEIIDFVEELIEEDLRQTITWSAAIEFVVDDIIAQLTQTGSE